MGNEDYKIHVNKETSFALELCVKLCDFTFTGAAVKDGDFVNLSAYADGLNLKRFLNSAAETFGLSLDIPEVFDIIVDRLRIDYIRHTLSFESVFDGFLKKCRFSYEQNSKDYLLAFTLEDFDFNKIPLLCEFAGTQSLGLTDASIIFSTDKSQYGDVSVEPGLSLSGTICGYKFLQLIVPYTRKIANDNTRIVSANENTGSPKIFWADVNKHISILTLHRAGFSYNNGDLGIMLDASASVKPFTLSLLGAGLQVNIDTKDIAFLISGLGIEFDNGFLTIGGAFQKSGEKYSGGLTIGVKTLQVTLAGVYENGHLLAYALVNANLGGPPAFFVTGLAAAFGYNKSIVLPEIEDIPEFPLVAAAIGKQKMTLAEMIGKLDNGCIIDCEGEKFVSAGIKFTTFNIIESFVLLNVSFGDKLTFSLLGTSNISMPPKTEKNPIASAQLALKAVVDPSEGVVSVQAQLMPESYIFDKDCKLAGGFAMFVWFGDNPHSGDFVISLGGYHPDYQKPSHYPDVPRLGINWRISNHLSVSGEMYFALTPSCIMAGVRMSAVYQNGNLKAWFIAQADFLIQWKPFRYSAHLCVCLGASYTVNCLFIHHTFTVELSADVNIWGPDFSGRVRVSWFIISFTIEFGEAKKDPTPLSFDEFSESFLPMKDTAGTESDRIYDDVQIQPLTIAVNGKVHNEKDGVKYVSADGLSFLVSSAVPISNADVDDRVVIRPMGDKPYTSDITFDSGVSDCTQEDYYQSVPTALWGGNGELRKVQSGYTVSFPQAEIKTFPENRFISLDELYQLNTEYYKGYKFQPPQENSYDNKNTIKEFSNTADVVGEARKAFLEKMGVKSPPDISLAVFAEKAESLFDEDILILQQKGI